MMAFVPSHPANPGVGSIPPVPCVGCHGFAGPCCPKGAAESGGEEPTAVTTNSSGKLCVSAPLRDTLIQKDEAGFLRRILASSGIAIFDIR